MTGNITQEAPTDATRQGLPNTEVPGTRQQDTTATSKPSSMGYSPRRPGSGFEQGEEDFWANEGAAAWMLAQIRQDGQSNEQPAPEPAAPQIVALIPAWASEPIWQPGETCGYSSPYSERKRAKAAYAKQHQNGNGRAPMAGVLASAHRDYTTRRRSAKVAAADFRVERAEARARRARLDAFVNELGY